MKAVFEDISKALEIPQERAAKTNFVLNVLAVLIVLSFFANLGTLMEDAREGSRYDLASSGGQGPSWAQLHS